MQDKWYDVWRDQARRDRLLKELAPFSYVTYPAQVRHIRAALHSVPWHQDTAYMRLIPEHRRHRKIITCFIPIELFPYKHTTIQFGRAKLDRNEEMLQHRPMEGFGAGIDELCVRGVFHCVLGLGDALVFGDLALHRTYTPEGCAVERRSLEFRLIEPGDALPERDYFDIERGAFIRTSAAAVRNSLEFPRLVTDC